MSRVQVNGLDQNTLSELRDKIENIAKSFTEVGHPRMNEDGLTGIAALHEVDVDDILDIVSMHKDQFTMTKSIKDKKIKSTVHQIKIKNAIGQNGTDYAMKENMLGHQTHPDFEKRVIPTRIYGASTSVSMLNQIVNQAGGFGQNIDVEKDIEEGVLFELNKQWENDAYYGCDYYLKENGDVDFKLPFETNSVMADRVRHTQGIQNFIRHGNRATYSIPKDMLGYGGLMSVVHDFKGQGLTQSNIDDVVLSVVESDLGTGLSEMMCTPSHGKIFRQQFFNLQRGDIGAGFDIKGPDVKSSYRGGFPVDTIDGVLVGKPTKFKRNRFSMPIRYSQSHLGGNPERPGAITLTPVAAKGTQFAAGDQIMIGIHAVNVKGSSTYVYNTVTINADGDGIEISIPAVGAANMPVEFYRIYATPRGANPTMDNLKFSGQVMANEDPDSATVTIHKESIMPNTTSILFKPDHTGDALVENNFYKAVVGGKAIHRIPLAIRGTATEVAYVSYFCFASKTPRSFALADNVNEGTRNQILLDGKL